MAETTVAEKPEAVGQKPANPIPKAEPAAKPEEKSNRETASTLKEVIKGEVSKLPVEPVPTTKPAVTQSIPARPKKEESPPIKQELELRSDVSKPSTELVPPKINDPPPYTPPLEEVFIAVMGQTGTGKTTFINNATGSDLMVGYNLESCTQDISITRTVIDNHLVTLIDTPGFDDTHKTYGEILQTLGLYLKATYDDKILLNGVIYLHRITDNRMQGTSLKSLRILKKLCGPEYYNNIALVTTMWNTINDPADGARREEQLKIYMDYWIDMIAAGAKVFRHDQGERSAKEIVRQLLPRKSMAMQFQKEISSRGIVGETSAGMVVKGYLEEVNQNFEAKLAELQKPSLSVPAIERENREEQEKEFRAVIEKMDKDIKRLNSKINSMEEQRVKEVVKKTGKNRKSGGTRYNQMDSLIKGANSNASYLNNDLVNN